MTLILHRVIKEEDKRILQVKEMVQKNRGRVRLSSNTYIYTYIYIHKVKKNGVKTKIEPHSSHLKVYLFMSGE